MILKYKLTDLAKDFNVDKKDLIDILNEKYQSTKKATSTLNEEELNFVFEHYSQKFQVENFEKYFKATAEKKPEIKKPIEKPVEKPINTTTPQNKNNGDKNNINTNENKPKTLKNLNTNKPMQNNNQRPFNNSNAQRPLQNNQTEQKAAQPNKNMQKFQNAQANQANRTNQTTQANPNNKKPVQPPVQNKPAKAREHFETIKPVGGLGNAVTTENRFTHVDTRGSYVELDKYNEKYEKIATPKHTLKDNMSTKQKITQKTQRNRRYKRDNEADKLRKIELEKQRRATLKITLPDEITVGDLALKLKVTAAEVIKRLMGIGVMASISDVIDFDTASLVAMEIGAKVTKEVVVTIEERLIDDTDDHDDNLSERSPVVVVMGHVDHGKTSLLDAIRNAKVISTEAGGITQHIGAYRVEIDGKPITFLDTPGHAAFTSMRARGAQLTDIAILVVAADDGIMPQTIEAINHAKAAGVSIIVAINKIDKPTANIDKVKSELAEHNLVCEDWGGDIICVPVSAKQNQNIDTLLEMVLLVAEVKELKANPNRNAKGVVIESKLDKGKGPLATVLVQNGTLKTGDAIICGKTFGRVRVMTDDTGEIIDQAGPSVPVEISGLSEVPQSGDILNAVEDEKLAKELVEQRKTEEKEEKFALYQKVTLDNLFNQIEQGEMKELPVIVKADVNGSVEAIKQSLEKLSCDEVRVKVIHGGVGAVTESDVMLASASNAII
ncbi:MAG: translation initiation factor IF-2, partial [Oscillospiraceae bacterium]